MVGDGSAATEGRIKQKVTRQSAPAMLLLRNVDRLGRNREGKADRRVMDFLGSVIGDLRRGGPSPFFKDFSYTLSYLCQFLQEAETISL